MKKIKITADNHHDEKTSDITHLIGQVFDVIEQSDEGVFIPYGASGEFFIWNDEFEYVEEE